MITYYARPGIETVDEILEGVFIEDIDPIQLNDQLMDEIMKINGLEGYINPKTRRREHRETRQWHMFLMIKLLKYSTTLAGEWYDLDHATAIHARRKISDWATVDKPFKKQYSNVIARCLEFDPDIFTETRWGKLV
jgi:chromosomal replication initiation ATPase DnaA